MSSSIATPLPPPPSGTRYIPPRRHRFLSTKPRDAPPCWKFLSVEWHSHEVLTVVVKKKRVRRRELQCPRLLSRDATGQPLFRLELSCAFHCREAGISWNVSHCLGACPILSRRKGSFGGEEPCPSRVAAAAADGELSPPEALPGGVVFPSPGTPRCEAMLEGGGEGWNV